MHDVVLYNEGLGKIVSDWEYGVGDKGYEGQDRVLSPWKGKKEVLSKEKKIWNFIINSNRARVENAFSRLKLFNIMKGPFRAKIESQLTKLQESVLS